jgi:LysR family nitrogen assimilation transcriptional regulator
MELRQLTALVTVAEVGSVTKATNLLHLVQPAVSRLIRLLEGEVGVPLFERTPQGMTLTSAGTVMVERSRRALLEFAAARAEIAPRSGEISGIVTIGLLESVLDVMVDKLLQSIRRSHPRITLRVLTAYSGYLQEWLDAGDVDLSLLYNLSSTPSVSVTPLLVEHLWAVAPPSAQLCPSTPLRWEDLLKHPVVLPIAGQGLRVLIDRARPETGLDPDVTLETNSLYLQKKFVLSGCGWTILPAVAVAADVKAGRLSAAPLTEPEITRSVVLGVQRGARISPAVKAVATEVANLAALLVTTRDWPSANLPSGDEDEAQNTPSNGGMQPSEGSIPRSVARRRITGGGIGGARSHAGLRQTSTIARIGGNRA